MLKRSGRSKSSARSGALWLCLLILSQSLCAPAALAQAGAGSAPPAALVPPPPATAPGPGPLPAPAPAPAPAQSPFALTGPDAAAGVTGEAAAAEPGIQLPGVSAHYVLGPGDHLLINDFSSGSPGQPVTSPVTPILPDGRVDIHPIGIIKAAGLTLQELTNQVNELAEKFIIKPDIEITVVKVRPNMVYILGEVLKPGLYTNEVSQAGRDQDPTVSPGANLTVVSALQRSGGIKETSDVRNIRITRLGMREPIKVNLWALLVEGDASQDIALQPGDVVFVPKGGQEFDPDALGLAAIQNRRVRIWGAVRQPGLLEMGPEDDVLSLISKAGGFTYTATTKWVYLSRLNRDGTVSLSKISIKDAISKANVPARNPVKPGDLVIVHDSRLKKGAYAAYTTGLYLASGIALVTYSILLSKAVFSTGSGTSTAIPVVPAGTGGGGGP